MKPLQKKIKSMTNLLHLVAISQLSVTKGGKKHFRHWLHWSVTNCDKFEEMVGDPNFIDFTISAMHYSGCNDALHSSAREFNREDYSEVWQIWKDGWWPKIHVTSPLFLWPILLHILIALISNQWLQRSVTNCEKCEVMVTLNLSKFISP